jgi:hypothetical protein
MRAIIQFHTNVSGLMMNHSDAGDLLVRSTRALHLVGTE